MQNKQKELGEARAAPQRDRGTKSILCAVPGVLSHHQPGPKWGSAQTCPVPTLGCLSRSRRGAPQGRPGAQGESYFCHRGGSRNIFSFLHKHTRAALPHGPGGRCLPSLGAGKARGWHRRSWERCRCQILGAEEDETRPDPRSHTLGDSRDKPGSVLGLAGGSGVLGNSSRDGEAAGKAPGRISAGGEMPAAPKRSLGGGSCRD